MTSNEEEFYSQMVKFLEKRNKEKDIKNTKFLISSLFCKNKVDRSTENINIFSKLGQLNIHIKDENDAQKFIKLYMNCANNTKMFINKGWSPNELLKNDPKNVSKIFKMQYVLDLKILLKIITLMLVML